jgi:hypothetical protein
MQAKALLDAVNEKRTVYQQVRLQKKAAKKGKVKMV